MAEAARARITVEEFLRWESGDDRRHELLGGAIVAMASPTEAHSAVTIRLGARIDEALRSRPPCRVLGEVGVRLSERPHDFYIADLAATCAPYAFGRRHVEAPLLIVEVLSPSAEQVDRKAKLPDYRTIPSVQEIALVDSATAYAEVHRRLADGRWLTDIIRGRDAPLRLTSVGVEIVLGQLYEGFELEEPQQAYRADG